MKKLLFTVALVGFSASVFAQGFFQLDMNNIANSISINTTANPYNGPLGLEVWLLNGTPSAATITAINSASNLDAYKLLTTDGFIKEPTPTYTFAAGSITMGSAYRMPDVTPAGSTVTVAVGAWNSTAASWSAMVTAASTDPSVRAGVFSWSQATKDYSVPPLPTAPGNQWAGADLVMTVVPEPGTFALAGLGAAALLIFRRRK